jgi:hypothetical protein
MRVVVTGNRVFIENLKVNKQDMRVRCFYAKQESANAVSFAESWNMIKYADVLFHMME